MKDRERQLLATIKELTESRGFPPTMRECAAAMKVSTTRVQQLVEECDRQGWLSRHPRISRSFKVLCPVLAGGGR